MAIELIGFTHEPEDMSAEWGIVRLKETMLIKMDSPLQNARDVQAELPAYGSASEPTFTIGLSYHPDDSSLVLKQASSVRPHSAGRPFWEIDLIYETAQWIDKLFPDEDQGKGNSGRAKRLTGSQVIKYPWDEPPTWEGSSKEVKTTVYSDSAGIRLIHANYLPLTEGIEIPLNLEQHKFTWNVEYDTFTYSTDVAPYVGKINSATVFGAVALNCLLESCTAVENYRTVNLAVPSGQSDTGATATHHFVTLTATFLIDRRGTTHGYFREANRRASMHTLQLYDPGQYGPIAVNARGDFATAPWPFPTAAKAATLGLALGDAYPYDQVAAADPSIDFFVIDPLYPLTAALATFVSTHGLTIP